MSDTVSLFNTVTMSADGNAQRSRFRSVFPRRASFRLEETTAEEEQDGLEGNRV